MFNAAYGDNIGGLRRRRFSWRARFGRIISGIGMWRDRARQRKELLHYLATDHRATMDLGIHVDAARAWARRPFWRA